MPKYLSVYNNFCTNQKVTLGHHKLSTFLMDWMDDSALVAF